jgi:hypothetical protein
VEAARAAYVIAAAGITSSWRDLVRVHGRFATIYASGCVAIRFGVLPFKQKELLAAILVCERDHLAFVDQEVRRLGALVIPAPDARKRLRILARPPAPRASGENVRTLTTPQRGHISSALLSPHQPIVDIGGIALSTSLHARNTRCAVQ